MKTKSGEFRWMVSVNEISTWAQGQVVKTVVSKYRSFENYCIQFCGVAIMKISFSILRTSFI